MTKIQIARKILKLQRDNNIKPSCRYPYVLSENTYKKDLEKQLEDLEATINNKLD